MAPTSNPDNDPRPRPRGILSKDDRQYLRGEKDLSDAGKRMARKRIRERVRHAIMDFALLYYYLEQRDREQIFLGSDDETPVNLITHDDDFTIPELEWDLVNPSELDFAVFTGGLRHMHAFAYLCLYDTYFRTNDNMDEPWVPFVIGDLVEEGLQDALGGYDVIADVEVSLTMDIHEFDPNDLEDLKKRFEEGDVSDEEVEWLSQLREIHFEEMVSYLHNENQFKES